MPKRHILYIEDDSAIVGAVQMILEKRLPVIVDPCMSAGGAELLLNRYCYDLIICDIGLPVVDGIQILEKVLQRDPGQPVMLFSDYDSVETRSQAARIGVPITSKFSRTSIEELVDQVTTLLEKRPCPEPLPRSERSFNAFPPIKLVSEGESKARAALQMKGCTVAGGCDMHKECQYRASAFNTLSKRVARAASHRLISFFFILAFPWC